MEDLEGRFSSKAMEDFKLIDMAVGGDQKSYARLLQRYRRIGERRYAYESPQGPYAATLEIAESGFVSVYPHLWKIESEA